MMYSSLISVMSGMNRFKGKVQHLTSLSIEQSLENRAADLPVANLNTGKIITQVWKTIEQALVAMFFWAILGFAAGFLMGMLHIG
jgi:ABC-type phosphate/phosphonate transport system permease subunit